jgi:hypothetical protein
MEIKWRNGNEELPKCGNAYLLISHGTISRLFLPEYAKGKWWAYVHETMQALPTEAPPKPITPDLFEGMLLGIYVDPDAEPIRSGCFWTTSEAAAPNKNMRFFRITGIEEVKRKGGEDE